MTAYLDGLRMLARRELSEAQIRQRLKRREHDPDAIDAAVAGLGEERAIDDVRVAAAIARTQTSIKRRGRRRVRRQIEQAGVLPAVARQAVDEVFGALDEAALLDAALGKRLRGRETIADDAEFRRLFRFLIGQGFEPDRVMAALNQRSARRKRATLD
ncbi:MAG: RecX family transcriptional regulator [Acidobacteriota bacterium]